MDTLAEGVEIDEQLEVLKREGCRNIQGYLFSKPMCSSDVTQLLDGNAGTLESKVA